MSSKNKHSNVDGPELIAHRGGAGENPENSLKAFKEASEHVGRIELDVRASKDGEVVVFHDEELSKITDWSGKVGDTDSERLYKTQIMDSGETIPSLEDVFNSVTEDTGLVIEVKADGIVDSVMDIADDYPNNVMISSFKEDVLYEVSQNYPDVETAYLFDENIVNQAFRYLPNKLSEHIYLPENTAQYVESALELGCDAIHPRLEACLGTDIVDEAQEAGLKVEAWTVSSVEEYELMRDAGVDSVITDVYTPILEKYGL